MYTLISFFLPMTIFALYRLCRVIIFKKRPNNYDYWFGIRCGAVIGFFLSIILTNTYAEYKSEKVGYNIVTLSDVSGTTGSFALGTGTINNTFYYCFYYHHIAGGFALGKVEANSSRIVEWDKNYGRVTWLEYETTNFEKWMGSSGEFKRYVIYVPKGSVVRSYRLDAN